MQYKTIVLELLQQQPILHEHLRLTRGLLSTVEELARELKSRHEHWRDQLTHSWTEPEPTAISSEAFELALEEMQRRMSSEPATDSGDSIPATETNPLRLTSQPE